MFVLRALPALLIYFWGFSSPTLTQPATTTPTPLSPTMRSVGVPPNETMFREECSVLERGMPTNKAAAELSTFGTGQTMSPLLLTEHLWPRNTVVFELSPHLSTWERSEVASAMAEIGSKTCILFREKEPWDRDYTRISVDSGVCGEAHVCRVGGGQYTNFGGSCRTSSVMVHELMHTLCFGHEHQRRDRDNWVTFDDETCNNQPPPMGSVSHDHKFMHYAYPYDYYSRMHYECNEDDECPAGGKPRVEEVKKCGRSVNPGLGVMDADKINDRYDCQDCFSHRWRPTATVASAIPQSHLLTLADHADIGICRGYNILGNLVIGTYDAGTGRCHLPGGGTTGRVKVNDTQVLTLRKSEKAFSYYYTFKSLNSFNAKSEHHLLITGGMRADGVPGFVGVRIGVDGKPVFGTVWNWKKDYKRPTLNYPYGLAWNATSFSFMVCVGKQNNGTSSTTSPPRLTSTATGLPPPISTRATPRTTTTFGTIYPSSPSSTPASPQSSTTASPPLPTSTIVTIPPTSTSATPPPLPTSATTTQLPPRFPHGNPSFTTPGPIPPKWTTTSPGTPNSTNVFVSPTTKPSTTVTPSPPRRPTSTTTTISTPSPPSSNSSANLTTWKSRGTTTTTKAPPEPTSTFPSTSPSSSESGISATSGFTTGLLAALLLVGACVVIYVGVVVANKRRRSQNKSNTFTVAYTHMT